MVVRRRCAVKDCLFQDLQDVRVYYFPRPQTRALKWRAACGNPALYDIPVEKLHKMRVVCKRHFSWDQFVHPLAERLNRSAVPNLFLPLDDSEDVPCDSEINKPLVPSVPQHVIFPPIDIVAAGELDATNDSETSTNACEVEENFYCEEVPSRDSRSLSPSEMLREIIDRTPKHALECTGDEIPEPIRPMAPKHAEKGETSTLVFTGPQSAKLSSALIPRENFHRSFERGEPLIVSSSTAEVALPDSPISPINDYFRYQLCGLCFSSRENMTYMFEDEDMDGFVIIDAIEDLLNFKVSKADDYPQFVCSHCLSMLVECKDFKDRVLKKKQAFDELLKKQRINVHGENSEVIAMSNVNSSEIDEESGNFPDTNCMEFSGGIEDIPESKAGERVVKIDEMCTTDKENENTSCEEYLEENAGPTESEAEGEEVISDAEELLAENVTECETSKKIYAEMSADEFRCKECGEGFKYLNHLHNHYKEHEKTRPLPCQYCCKRFTSLTRLNEHIIIHSDYKPFECEHCRLRCRSKLTLIIHKQIHSNEKPYLCSFCGMGFRTQSFLNVHARQHGDAKPYICDECGIEFKSSQRLKNHVRMHTQNLPFMCTECGKAYRSDASLRKHIRYMHSMRRKKRKLLVNSDVTE